MPSRKEWGTAPETAERSRQKACLWLRSTEGRQWRERIGGKDC